MIRYSLVSAQSIWNFLFKNYLNSFVHCQCTENRPNHKTCFSQIQRGPRCDEQRCYSPVESMATTKEEATLLPTSSSPTKREGRFLVSRAFCILHLLAFALLVCWLTLLTFQSWRPEAREEIIRQLVSSQEVRDPWFFNQISFGPSLGSWKEANGQ